MSIEPRAKGKKVTVVPTLILTLTLTPTPTLTLTLTLTPTPTLTRCASGHGGADHAQVQAAERAQVVASCGARSPTGDWHTAMYYPLAMCAVIATPVASAPGVGRLSVCLSCPPVSSCFPCLTRPPLPPIRMGPDARGATCQLGHVASTGKYLEFT